MKFPNSDLSLQMAESLIRKLSDSSEITNLPPSDLGYYNKYLEPQSLTEQFSSAENLFKFMVNIAESNKDSEVEEYIVGLINESLEISGFRIIQEEGEYGIENIQEVETLNREFEDYKKELMVYSKQRPIGDIFFKEILFEDVNGKLLKKIKLNDLDSCFINTLMVNNGLLDTYCDYNIATTTLTIADNPRKVMIPTANSETITRLVGNWQKPNTYNLLFELVDQHNPSITYDQVRGCIKVKESFTNRVKKILEIIVSIVGAISGVTGLIP